MEEIKGSDIMIGNYFHIDGFPMYISGILNTTVYMDFNGNEAGEWEEYIKDLVPIPRTEDILLKAGFEKKDNDYPTDFIEWCEKEFPVIGVLCQSSDKTYLFDEETDTLRIHYLHQLQNLFKSLTGSDLKIEV